jgi:hypothetical protein
MEGLFGWSKSAIQRWFVKLAWNLSAAMKIYNHDFLTWKGELWQRAVATEWAQQKLNDDSIQLYLNRIRAQNAQSAEGIDSIDYNCIGSLGAADGTISVSPRITEKVLASQGEDPSTDRMYCEYKKTHGWKLIAFISHKAGPTGKKYILKVKSAVGSCFDGTLYSSMIQLVISQLILGVFFLCDHAFHRQLLALCPYTTAEINASIIDAPELSRFNHNHSSSRMCSEHGMRYLKSWGIIRGRSDHWLFSTNELFEVVLDSVWALHNYQADGCPDIKF